MKSSTIGGGKVEKNDEGNPLIDQQIAQNNAELEQKRQAISKERLDIIKSQGAPQWTPEPLASTISPKQEQESAVDKFKKEHGVRGGF